MDNDIENIKTSIVYISTLLNILIHEEKANKKRIKKIRKMIRRSDNNLSFLVTHV